MFRTAVLIVALAACIPLRAAVFASDTNDVAAPKIAPASDEAERAMKRFRIPKGFKVELFAAEPMLANPVCFTIDEKNRFYVAETFRLHAGVTDIRDHMNWLDEELASTSVDDRVEMMKRHEGKRISDYEKESDRVRMIWDQDGDGKADHSTVFADGFNGVAEGLGAGLLARRGGVYYANIPNLWLLRDSDKDGVADSRSALLTGFGVRVGFLGHDLHGLRFGPDGKLYFSIGDRGAHVMARDGLSERLVANHEEGVVYRCNADGSGLEIFARGLRNPQELAFDAYGNLWTGDNNSDGGDPARWVYVVEGGDSGWRVGFQFLTQPNPRGVWISERMCYPQFAGQAAFLIPPVALIANGPAGLAYYPGAGLGDRYTNHFFLCDFRGSTSSGVHSFGVKPHGAGFEMTDRHEFIWEVLVTDGDFGYDGCYYISDWVQGWNKTGKGRLYRVYDPSHVKDRAVKETRELFQEGFDTMSLNKLTPLLGHPDMRVRQEAQFTIVDLGPATALRAFQKVLHAKDSPFFARLHCIWGLGQLAPHSDLAVRELLRLLENPEAEIRAQAAKVLSDAHRGNTRTFEQLLADPSLRVRFFAALALSKIPNLDSLDPILAMLRENADRDVYLRHAGVLALGGVMRLVATEPARAMVTPEAATAETLRKQQTFDAVMADQPDSVRMALLLAMRRIEAPGIARFLQDTNPLIVAEAARAINDLPIEAALPRLAALIGSTNLNEVPAGDDRSGPRDGLIRRVLNANYRVGLPGNATALAAFAATGNADDNARAEALAMLREWEGPSDRDRITGLWRPLEDRDLSVAATALQPYLAALVKSSSDKLKIAATKTAGVLHIKTEGAEPFDLVLDTNAAPALRLEALKSLANAHDGKLPDAVQFTLNDRNETLRKEAMKLQAQADPDGALPRLRATLENGTIGEKQTALAIIGSLPGGPADEIIRQWLDQLLAGTVPAELQLDLLEAAALRQAPPIRMRLAKYNQSRPAADDLRNYRECLAGGNAEEGKRVFIEKAEVSCVKCHKFEGEGGEVGPELSGIGARHDRNYILESLVLPNKAIAPGFESVNVTLKSGTTYLGQLKKETPEALEINTPEDGLVKVKKSEVKSRERGLSAMPEELRQVLTKTELRNLVEFLASSKETKTAAK